MALISCPECGQSVSSLAGTCPHCGYGIAPQPQQSYQTHPVVDYLEKWRQRRIIVGIVFLVIWVLVMITIFGSFHHY